MRQMISGNRVRKGFTLVELAVVIVIIGVLAAFGVPKFLQSVEKSKAAEAFNYLSTVAAAQERYLAQNGIYLADASVLHGQRLHRVERDFGQPDVDLHPHTHRRQLQLRQLHGCLESRRLRPDQFDDPADD
jgi:prepilin-type N-terminal cleavage/methylation domain-containing protein